MWPVSCRLELTRDWANPLLSAVSMTASSLSPRASMNRPKDASKEDGLDPEPHCCYCVLWLVLELRQVRCPVADQRGRCICLFSRFILRPFRVMLRADGERAHATLSPNSALPNEAASKNLAPLVAATLIWYLRNSHAESPAFEYGTTAASFVHLKYYLHELARDAQVWASPPGFPARPEVCNTIRPERPDDTGATSAAVAVDPDLLVFRRRPWL